MRDRLMVGHWPLKPSIIVRIYVPQDQEPLINNETSLSPGDHDLFINARSGLENSILSPKDVKTVFRRARVKYEENPIALHIIDTYDPFSPYTQLIEELKSAYENGDLGELDTLYNKIQNIYPDIQIG
ncbi:MAG: hypothetical protein US29_C0058G0003 [candidate division WS6 bacterium GW2011_GWF1_36_8]|uniref:Uncharacterized protein n=1 Tax=candidate division WS6 bacterium GW2011_GWF1_36_8 TaxID=1619098 RepID=A0A0G0FA85_9BACT|nr:MAG: hypothetical protein US29_C0058G0003 [candidate division WS6 bacterium GW2011_GWF1_36_8]